MGQRKDFDAFLKDLLTESEILMVARRIGVAQLLLAGFSHRQIIHIMEVGCATVERVDRWLQRRWMDYRILDDLPEGGRTLHTFKTRQKHPVA